MDITQQPCLKGTFAIGGHLDSSLNFSPNCQSPEFELDLLKCDFGKGMKPVRSLYNFGMWVIATSVLKIS